MWLLAFGPAAFGVLRHRRWSYWRWVAAIFVAVAAGEFLFSGRGTVEHPEFDGLVIQALRNVTGDEMVGLVAGLVFLALFWIFVIYCARRLYLDARSPEDGSPAAPVGNGRKAVELILLTVVTTALFYVGARSASAREQALAADAALDTMLDMTVATVNTTAPSKLDEVTVLTRASREGRTLVLDHEVTEKAITREAMTAYLKDKKRAEVCGDADTRRLLDDGGALRYRYALAGAPGAPVVFDLPAHGCSRPGGS